MNYILNKSNKQVVWINSDSNQMTGIDAWANFKSDQHEIVYSLHYNPQIGDTFVAEIKDGVAQGYKPKTVYSKISGEERILQSWEDQIDLETETEDEPRRDGSGSVLPHQVFTETNGWILDLIQKKDSLIRLVNSICESKITAGFVSSALGAPHFYNSDRDDQLNLVGLVSLNTSVLHKCTDEDGIKEERKHTFDQIKQVLGDGVARKTFLLQRCASLKAIIQSIERVDELDNVI